MDIRQRYNTEVREREIERESEDDVGLFQIIKGP